MSGEKEGNVLMWGVKREKFLSIALIWSLAFGSGIPGFTSRVLAAEETDSTLQPGYLIALSSSEDKDLNGSFRVPLDGEVALPYGVRIDTTGMSFDQFRTKVLKAYGKFFNGAPRLGVRIRQRRLWVDVRGIVKSPGAHLINPGSSLDEVISQAGGIEENVRSGYLKIEQGKDVSWLDLGAYFKYGSQAKPIVWRGGDRLFFQKERPSSGNWYDDMGGEIQVLGEVRSPGAHPFRSNMDAYYYLVRTGGPTPMADLERVELVRTEPESGRRQSVSFGPISRVNQLQESDILIVHPQRQSSFERTLQGVAMVSTILSAIVLTTIAVQGAR